MASKRRLWFAVSQTPDSRRVIRLNPALRGTLKRCAILCAAEELAGLETELSVVLLGEAEMLELNNRILGHDWHTDIITVELDRESDRLEAELYLGVMMARENAVRYRATLEDELSRLVIHGLLHLAGYDDHTPVGKKRMRNRERFFLRKSEQY